MESRFETNRGYLEYKEVFLQLLQFDWAEEKFHYGKITDLPLVTVPSYHVTNMVIDYKENL